MCVCGEWSAFKAKGLDLLWPVNSSNRLQGREVEREVGQWSGDAASDYYAINHQAAASGVIALDAK